MKIHFNLFVTVFLACVAAGVVFWALACIMRARRNRQAALAFENRPQIGFGAADSTAAD